MERANLRSGLDDVLALSRRGNEWIQENKLDNALLGRLDIIITMTYY